ncbi:eukaryotic long-chain fatty acid CoA synthetase (LC-FACS) [Trifolium repens]|nr:eukaryotic long-chain fatty acid CoA synthetase (LC-FACS) [Trifolium repens]
MYTSRTTSEPKCFIIKNEAFMFEALSIDQIIRLTDKVDFGKAMSGMNIHLVGEANDFVGKVFRSIDSNFVEGFPKEPKDAIQRGKCSFKYSYATNSLLAG